MKNKHDLPTDKKEAIRDSWTSNFFDCDCGNTASKSEKKICEWCGRLICNDCRHRHGKKQYYEFNIAGVCFKDDDIKTYHNRRTGECKVVHTPSGRVIETRYNL